MSDISVLIQKMYGHHYTPQTISNMTKAMSEQVEAFKALLLDARYVCVYLDATCISLKRDTVSKKVVYIVVGIRANGSKEVLAYTVAPTESAFVWEEVLLDLNERGVEEILLFISDGLKGITDRKKILEDFKSVYLAESRELGEKIVESLCRQVENGLSQSDEVVGIKSLYFHFYDFPKSIWRSIYSTNLIESFNKKVKKYSKRKEQFPNEDSLDRFLVSQFEIYNQNFSTLCHIGFNQARAELTEMFKQT